MAGKNIRSYLNPPDPERFYELCHVFSEEIMVRILAMNDYCQLLKIYARTFPDITITPTAATHLEEFLTFTKEFHDAELNFFFPDLATVRTQNKLSRIQRWEPYDESAWDVMVSQAVEMLKPFIAQARKHHEIAVSEAVGESQHWEPLRFRLDQINTYLNELAQFHDPQKVESLFRFRSAQSE